jgi:hypothetical protein
VKLTEQQTQTIINALRAAAELYQRDAEALAAQNHDRVVAQFHRQTAEAEELADLLAEGLVPAQPNRVADLSRELTELRAELEFVQQEEAREAKRRSRNQRRLEEALTGAAPTGMGMTADQLIALAETLRASAAPAKDPLEVGQDPARAELGKDPLVVFLEGLTWDRTPRCDSWLTIYWGAEDTEENRKIGRSWLLEAVARAFRPGVAGGRVFVPYGPNRSVMHAMILSLAPHDEWASYISKMHLFGPSLSRYLAYQWIVGLDPMLLCQPDGIARLRDMLSANAIRCLAFDEKTHKTDRKLRAVYACALSAENNRDLLNPARFLQVRAEALGALQPDRLRQDVSQLWAEAVHTYRSGALAEIP